MGESQNKKTTTLVLVGKTGNGKSSTGNSILGRDEFFTKTGLTSVTPKCQLGTTDRKDGRILNVVDTPGLFGTNVDQSIVSKEVARCIEFAKDGFHGVLLVVSLRNRFTTEEAAVLDCLQILFGPEITNYIVVVFTGGDELKYARKTLQQFLEDCPKALKDLLKRCDDRMVVFNNRTNNETKKAEQVDELLKQIDAVVARNEGEPYTNELFLKFQAMARNWSPQIRTNEDMAQILATINTKLEVAVAHLQKQLASETDARREAENKIIKLTDEIAQLKKPKPKPSCL